MRQLLRRLWYLIRFRQLDADLAEEIEFHRAMTQQAIEDRGVVGRDAVFAARRALGNIALARDNARDVWRPRWLQGVSYDVRLAVRVLVRAPLVSAVAILSLGLGIGANTAIFSLINSVYLRPLPVHQPERLVSITAPTRSGRPWRGVRDYIETRSDLFVASAAHAGTQFNVSPTVETQWVDGLWAGGSLFQTLRVPAFAGRLLTPNDDRPNGGADGNVAVISHAFWRRRFLGSGDAIGRTVHVNRVPFTIVGVTPPDFFGPVIGRSFDVAVPLATAAVLVGEPPGTDLIARLRPGLTVAQVNAALGGADVLAALRMPQDEPLRAIPVDAASSDLRTRYQRPLAALMIVVVLVLLIACANVANLLLARATATRHELSVRRTLGAPGWRVVRQCLVDSMVLATAAALCGLVIAFWATRLLVRELSREDALTAGQIAYGSARLFLDMSFDWRVLTFTTGAAALTALAFGLAPALRSARVDPIEALKQGATTATQAPGRAGFRGGRLRVGATGWILVAQVALSLVLVVAAGLFVRTFAAVSSVPLGLDVDRTLVVDVNAARAVPEPAERLMLYERVRDAVGALPGVVDAALSLGTPPIGVGVHEQIEVAGAAPPADQHALAQVISPGWFQVFRVPVIVGRGLTDSDRRGAPMVAVVNEAFARRFLSGGSPLGRLITSFEAPIEIVGVVGDTVSGPPQARPDPVVYVPLAQADGRLREMIEIHAESGLSLSVRAIGPRTGLTRAIVQAAERVDPELDLTFRLPDDEINALITRERVLALLSGSFGVLALALAALGLYGIVAYTVARQRREIAIRMALGSTAWNVVGLVLGRVMMLLGLGVAAGSVISLFFGQFAATLLYGVEAQDLTALGGAILTLVTVATVVGWMPARRASRMDPAVVLRSD